MRPLHGLKPRIRAVKLPYPAEIFGTVGKTLHPVRCVIVDIIETMAAMLVNDDVVGRRGEHFHHEFAREYNEDEEQTFCNVTSAGWFKKTEEAIRERWGHDVYLLAFTIACDKTAVDRVGGISVWPCYLTIMNVDSSVRRREIASDIVGYVPVLAYTDSQLEQILKDKCGVLRNFVEVIKLVKYYMEQSFHYNLLLPIKERETLGPIKLQVGKNSMNTKKFIPKLMVYICKYTQFITFTILQLYFIYYKQNTFVYIFINTFVELLLYLWGIYFIPLCLLKTLLKNLLITMYLFYE